MQKTKSNHYCMITWIKSWKSLCSSLDLAASSMKGGKQVGEILGCLDLLLRLTLACAMLPGEAVSHRSRHFSVRSLHRFLASGAVAILLSPSNSQLYQSPQPVLPLVSCHSFTSFVYFIVWTCACVCICTFLYICIYAVANGGYVSKTSHFFLVTPKGTISLFLTIVDYPLFQLKYDFATCLQIHDLTRQV